MNHEEVVKALEEGVCFIENMSPVEAIPDQYGAIEALRFKLARELGKIRCRPAFGRAIFGAVT